MKAGLLSRGLSISGMKESSRVENDGTEFPPRSGLAAQRARSFLRRDPPTPAAHASSAAASSKSESGSGTLLGPHTSPGGQGLTIAAVTKMPSSGWFGNDPIVLFTGASKVVSQ